MPPATIRQSRTVQSAAVILPAPARKFTITSTILTVIQSSGDLINWRDRTTGTNLFVTNNQPQEFYRGNPDYSVVHVSWDPSPDATVSGYKIYSGPASHGYRQVFDVGNVTSAAITMTAHPTNYLAATCYDAAGSESDFSNEVIWRNQYPTLKIQ